MLNELLLKDEIWKTMVSALPVIAALWKCSQYLYQFFRNGKVLKLRHFYKEYGEHLGSEDKKFISNLLRKKIMTQLIGVTNDAVREKIIYISNRCNLGLPTRTIVILSRYLKYDGKYFYFVIDKKYRRKKKAAWVAGVLYLTYGLAPLKIYHDIMLEQVPMSILIIFSIFCILISLFLFTAYPSSKRIQGLNGRMLKVNGSEFKDNKNVGV